jgi:hypothetical protein
VGDCEDADVVLEDHVGQVIREAWDGHSAHLDLVGQVVDLSTRSGPCGQEVHSLVNGDDERAAHAAVLLSYHIIA